MADELTKFDQSVYYKPPVQSKYIKRIKYSMTTQHSCTFVFSLTTNQIYVQCLEDHLLEKTTLLTRPDFLWHIFSSLIHSAYGISSLRRPPLQKTIFSCNLGCSSLRGFTVIDFLNVLYRYIFTYCHKIHKLELFCKDLVYQANTEFTFIVTN